MSDCYWISVGKKKVVNASVRSGKTNVSMKQKLDTHCDSIQKLSWCDLNM